MRSTKFTFTILVGVFVLILVYNVPVKADFSPDSYNSIEDCIKATGAQIVLKSDTQYPDARCGERIRVYTVPTAISYPTNSTQVSWLVRCSTKFNLQPVPRSGGHSSEGYSSVNNSVVIDLSYMDSVDIDQASQTAQVGGGCRLGPLYIKLDQAGFTIISGLHPTVGLSGIIAAGGWGLQSRNYGVTGDSVLEAEMVTADGNTIIASDTSHSDLFWALRGGGGGTFGIVTSWKLKLIPAWSQVSVFHIGYPFQYAEQAITAWVNWAWKERNDVTAILTITHDGPPIDEHQYGIKIRGHFLGTQDELQPIIDNSGIDNITQIACVEYLNCSNLGSRAYFLGDDYDCSRTDLFNIGNYPYTSVNYSLSIASTFTNTTSISTTYSVTYNGEAGNATSGVITNFGGGPGPLQIREFEKSKSMYFNATLTVTQIKVIVGLLQNLPPGAFIQFEPYGGIFANQSNKMTAFSHRADTSYHLLIGVALTGNPASDSVVLEWIKSWDVQVRPFSNGESYVGYVDADIKSTSANPLSVYFGDNVGQLDVVKTTYDAKNIFTNSLEDNLSGSSSACCVDGTTCRLPSIRKSAAAAPLRNNRDIWLMWFGTLLAIIMGMENFFQLIVY